MYFGSSAIVDLALCAGLGVAAACCVAAAIKTANVIASTQVRDALKNVLGVIVFLLSGGALLSIAAFIGGTKSVRDANSVLGFVIGAVAVVLFGVLLRRIGQSPRQTAE